MAGTGKKGRGRKKIEIKRLESLEDRVATFSKRKSGVYKKASEISTACGADVGLVAFSPTGKPFSWGSPSIGAVVNRFLNRNTGSATNDMLQAMLFNLFQRNVIDKEVQEFSDLLSLLELSKKQGKALEKMTNETRDGAGGELAWWQRPPSELTFEELKRDVAATEALHKDLSNHLNQDVNLMTLDEISRWMEELARA